MAEIPRPSIVFLMAMSTCRLPAFLLILLLAPAAAWTAEPRFEVSVSGVSEPVTGRLIVLLAERGEPEPRLAIGLTGSAILGTDVEQLPPRQVAVVDGKAVSYPIERLEDLPAGEYFVQAVLIRYEQVRRADGHSVWLPMQHRRIAFQTLPGNLFSKVQWMRLDPAAGFTVKLDLSEVIPRLDEPADTPWLRHFRLQSKLLSKFWGKPVYLRATALVPRDFDARPDARYPAVYAQSHGPQPYYFNPDPASHEKQLGVKRGNVQTGYEFYQSWIADDFPRLVVVSIEQSSPYFLEAYSVDSANHGPYGQALTQELIPYLEKKLRLIREPHARIVQGASTGGWESLALQLYYPDFFGGAWIFNPDPIDFRHYQLVDIYKDENAFSVPITPLLRTERPFRRTTEGQLLHTLRQLARFEAVMGSKGRSGYQLDAWQAVHGPVGADGYPVPLFDKLTGAINRDVASYMRERGYDLTEYARRNWPTLGPKLLGKLHFFAGEMDDFYLNLAVYDFEEMLAATREPHYPGRFEYGRPKKGHNWHLTNFAEMLREIATHMKKNAPPEATPSQWSY